MKDRQLPRAARVVVYCGLALILIAARPRFQISEDRDLKESDLKAWDCLDRLEGSAKTLDGMERNRLKNRSAPDIFPTSIPRLDTAGYLKLTSEFDAETKAKRRKDLDAAQKEKLDRLEQQIVQLTGYLVFAYSGPTEATNCGSVDHHDWHLELFEKPADHAPQPGDPTPIVCEITPRTENAIYRDGFRIQESAAFFRRADLEVEATGRKAAKVRVTGYLLWDDEHNGKADVGPTINTVGAKKYHNPWRSSAWEVHPVFRIERVDETGPMQDRHVPAAATPSSSAVEKPKETVTPQLVTITRAVKIKIPYGETMLPLGAKLPIVSRDGQNVTVRYMDSNYAIPIGATDLR